MICFLRSNEVNVVSFQAPWRGFPILKEDVAVGKMVLSSSYTSGNLYCSFRRKLAVSIEKSDYMLDLNQDQYAIWASGGVNNGLPAFHITYFESSLGAINIPFEPGLVSVHSVKILLNTGSIEKVTGSCHLPWIRVFRSFSNI